MTPLHHMRKDKIVWLATHRCQHRHTFLEHYDCFLAEVGHRERVGIFDLEASNLDADFGIMLSWCILDDATGKIIHSVLTERDVRAGIEDKRLVKQCVSAFKKFDRIVGFYSSRFDIPFLRARALINKIDFPVIGTIHHYDVYFTIKARFKLSSRRQENACRHLLGHTLKTRIDAKYWRAGVRGDKKSLQYILSHNKADVRDLRELYHKVKDFSRYTNTSI